MTGFGQNMLLVLNPDGRPCSSPSVSLQKSYTKRHIAAPAADGAIPGGSWTAAIGRGGGWCVEAQGPRRTPALHARRYGWAERLAARAGLASEVGGLAGRGERRHGRVHVLKGIAELKEARGLANAVRSRKKGTPAETAPHRRRRYLLYYGERSTLPA